MATLGVNIDHVATLREARGTNYPSVKDAAKSSIDSGASQITVHLREDRRHINENDVVLLKENISVPLNLEMSVAAEIVNIATKLKPETATLVPEKREELTTEGGLDLHSQYEKIKNTIIRLKNEGTQVSLFIEPDLEHIELAKELGSTIIELHTGRYSELKDSKDIENELERLKSAAIRARKLNLKVAAGHGLNYDNIAKLVANVPEIVEYNVGHAIIAKAVFTGLNNAVEEFIKLINKKEE